MKCSAVEVILRRLAVIIGGNRQSTWVGPVAYLRLVRRSALPYQTAPYIHIVRLILTMVPRRSALVE